MSKLIDYTPGFLAAIVGIFFMWGVGYLITTDNAERMQFKQQCIESGMQYVSGSCVK